MIPLPMSSHEKHNARRKKTGKVTLGDLFMGIALFMPSVVVVGEVRQLAVSCFDTYSAYRWLLF